MSGKVLLAVIAVVVLGGVIGGLVVVFVRDAPPSVVQVKDTGAGAITVPPTIIIQAPPAQEKPRAKSHYIKPGQVDRI
jgi:uncharacterized membrane protein YqiK